MDKEKTDTIKEKIRVWKLWRFEQFFSHKLTFKLNYAQIKDNIKIYRKFDIESC